LSLNKVAIDKRAQMILSYEAILTALSNFPWSKIQIISLLAWSKLYQNFSDELSKLPKPPELKALDDAAFQKTVQEITVPISQKSQEILVKAQHVASDLGIEGSLYQKIKPLKQNSVGVLLIAQKKDWMKEIHDSNKDFWSQLFLKAFEEKNYPQIIFYLEEVKNKKILQMHEIHFLKAYLLLEVSAQAEALLEFGELLKSDGKVLGDVAKASLVQAYYQVENTVQTSKWISLLDKFPPLTGEEKKMLEEATLWSKAPVQESLKGSLEPGEIKK
jgi:hypothetical protein